MRNIFFTGSFLGTQALESLAMVGYVLATIFIVIYVATEKARTRCFAITIMTFSLASSKCTQHAPFRFDIE